MIGIIVPVFNSEKYLEQCVSSLIAQTYYDICIILIDDGSTDKSLEICRKYEEKDNRIVVIHQENKGVSAARNTGIEYALSLESIRHIGFVDSDDCVHPDFIQTLYNGIIENDVNISICNLVTFSEEVDDDIDINNSFVKMTSAEYWCKYHTQHEAPCWNKLFEKELWNAVRFPYGKRYEDVATTWKCLFSTDKVAVTDARLYYYRMNPSSFCHEDWSPVRLQVIEVIEEELVYFAKNQIKEPLTYAMDDYIFSLNNNIKMIKELKLTSQYEDVLRELNTKLRNAVNVYRDMQVPFKNHEWIWLIINPFRTRVILHLRSLKTKVEKWMRKKKETLK